MDRLVYEWIGATGVHPDSRAPSGLPEVRALFSPFAFKQIEHIPTNMLNPKYCRVVCSVTEKRLFNPFWFASRGRKFLLA
jgi:hypothetical protein